jgi:catechol 2,3-dioxygenase-like lactoylglutathione lyase family enzyme
MTKSKLLRMDNVGIVVDDMKAAIAFFAELGLELAGEATVEGKLVDRMIGVDGGPDGVKSDIAMMRTPDGHSRLELSKFHRPKATGTKKALPVNTLGMGRIMFAVENIEDVLSRLRILGAELVGEVVRYEDAYLLCYVRGPEGIIIALAEELS